MPLRETLATADKQCLRDGMHKKYGVFDSTDGTIEQTLATPEVYQSGFQGVGERGALV